MEHHNINIRNRESLFLKKRIMRKIYLIWFFKKIGEEQMIKIITPFIVFPLVFYRIDVFSVIKNATGSSSSFGDFLRFFLNNFQAAEMVNKFTVSILIVFIGIVFWDVFRKGLISSFLKREV